MSAFVSFIKKTCVLLLCLTALVFGALFAFENPNELSPVLFGQRLPSISMGYYFVCVLAVGISIGFALAIVSMQFKLFQLRKQNRQLQRNTSNQHLTTTAVE